jgi:oligopeptide/dipeptide ABC transporter ATP-binding protein
MLEMLSKVGISPAAERAQEYPHTLSGGLRQRAFIAMTLAAAPSLLIADEPTTALDVTLQAQILQLLHQLQQEKNLSILLVTHDLSLVAGFCDRVYVMYGGKVVESAPVETLFDHPTHPYTQQLLAAIPRLDRPKTQSLLSIEGAPLDPLSLLKGCIFQERCSHKTPRCAVKHPSLQGSAHQVACHEFFSESEKK